MPAAVYATPSRRPPVARSFAERAGVPCTGCARSRSPSPTDLDGRDSARAAGRCGACSTRAACARSRSAATPCPAGARRCFYAGFVMIAAALTSLGSASQDLLYVHMVEHLLLGDIAALLIVLGLTGPLLAPILRISCSTACARSRTPRSPSRCGRSTCTSGTCPRSTRRRCATPAIHALEHAMFLGFGVNMWMCLFGPLPTPAGSATSGRLGLHRRRAPHRRPCSATSSCGRAPSSTPSTCHGDAASPHLAARRPEHRRRDHDGRGVVPHARACSAGCSCAPPERARSARTCSTTPTQQRPRAERRACRARRRRRARRRAAAAPGGTRRAAQGAEPG